MGEDDNEALPVECQPKLDCAKVTAAPIDSHRYSNATHCRDCRNVGDFDHLRIGNLPAWSFEPAFAN